jgi:hypothetical protein
MAKPDRNPPDDKEAKLAQALRANLRRRKAPPPPRDDSAADEPEREPNG